MTVTDVNQCQPNPCRNGGHCVSVQNTYTCLCPTGFAGHNCQYSNLSFFVVTRHSLVRAKGEAFVLLYAFFVCFFVRSTIYRQLAGRFTPQFACGRTLVPDVSAPVLRVSGLRRTEKGEMKFLLLWESMGNFCILAVFERYLSNA